MLIATVTVTFET